MTPTVIQRLREAIHRERSRSWGPDDDATNAAIAAVEQELAAKDQEIAELRKRPTLDEIREHCVNGREWKDVRVAFEDAYAAKARAEIQK